MMTKFHNVSERFRRGAEVVVLSSLKQFSFFPGTAARNRRHCCT